MKKYDDKEMWIAPKRDGSCLNWRVADYQNLKFSSEEDWKTAIQIFEDRIRGRFLDVIDQVISQCYTGFAIMALDCLLIETLEQFRQGTPETPRGKVREYFVNFLTQTAFREYFDQTKAELFYETIRNGILHQAEIKGSSRIRIDVTDMVKVTEDGKGLIINRDLFHQKLVEVFEDYLSDLQRGEDKTLRECFRKKMNAICNVMYYFAYGSNMDTHQVQERLSLSKVSVVGVAELRGWRLTFDKISKDGTGKANLFRDETSSVWGVVYQLSNEQIKLLDNSEKGYKRTLVQVRLRESQCPIEAYTYISDHRNPRLSIDRNYLQKILNGAHQHSLPETYIQQIESLSKGG